MSQRVFDAFVFDLDGTLVDTASELIAAYQKLCIELGGGEKPFDDARKLISHGSGRLVTEATGIEEGDPMGAVSPAIPRLVRGTTGLNRPTLRWVGRGFKSGS